MYRPRVNVTNRHWSHKIHNAFPSFMDQRHGSDNQKLLSVITSSTDTLKDDFRDLTNQRLLQNASGKMLDRIAADWGVDIVDENDDEFKRFQIRFQMLRHRIGPAHVKSAIAFLFNIDPKSFSIVSTGLKAVKVTNLPFNFDTGDKTEIKHELAAKFIRGMMPPEYQLRDVEYQAHAEIWVYTGISVPRTPIILRARQYVSPLTLHARSYIGYHANSVSIVRTRQLLPTIHYHAKSTLGSHHAAEFPVFRAKQTRKDQ